MPGCGFAIRAGCMPGRRFAGYPFEASRGILHGWYEQNGVSLGNPRLGFICVPEDVTGQFGLCGYFREYDRDDLLACSIEIWRGAIHFQCAFMDVACETAAEQLTWTIKQAVGG